MLLRKQIEINQRVSERSDKYIFAERISNTYALKFIRFGKLRINMRVYLVDKPYFDTLISNFGKLVTSYSVVDRYLILPRKAVEVWAARNRRYKTTNVYLVYPSGKEQKVNLTVDQLKEVSPSKLEWFPEGDDKGNQWLVTHFRIGGNLK